MLAIFNVIRNPPGVWRGSFRRTGLAHVAHFHVPVVVKDDPGHVWDPGEHLHATALDEGLQFRPHRNRVHADDAFDRAVLGHEEGRGFFAHDRVRDPGPDLGGTVLGEQHLGHVVHTATGGDLIVKHDDQGVLDRVEITIHGYELGFASLTVAALDAANLAQGNTEFVFHADDRVAEATICAVIGEGQAQAVGDRERLGDDGLEQST